MELNPREFLHAIPISESYRTGNYHLHIREYHFPVTAYRIPSTTEFPTSSDFGKPQPSELYGDERVVIQQLREAFPYDSAPGYLIFDRGANFNEEVVNTMKSFGIHPKRTSFRSPWQNGVAERFVGSGRRDLLDHVIVLNERHLKRLMNEYVRYYHEDRTYLGLGNQTPGGRVAAENTNADSNVVSMPRLGGLHHRYDLAA